MTGTVTQPSYSSQNLVLPDQNKLTPQERCCRALTDLITHLLPNSHGYSYLELYRIIHNHNFSLLHQDLAYDSLWSVPHLESLEFSSKNIETLISRCLSAEWFWLSQLQTHNRAPSSASVAYSTLRSHLQGRV